MSCFNELQNVIATFFNVNLQLISAKTSAHDIQEWDSFSHMELMNHIEDHFKLKIPFSDIMEFNNVGDITTYLNSKTA
jgi:acyl carrier protein